MNKSVFMNECDSVGLCERMIESVWDNGCVSEFLSVQIIIECANKF